MSGKANANSRFLRCASSVVEPFFLACAEICSCSKQKSRLLFIKTECLLIRLYTERCSRNSIFEYPVVQRTVT